MTSYDSIFNRFAQKITDYKLLELSDSDVINMMRGWLLSAISKTKTLKNDLSDRDDITMYFNSDLLDVEKEILALGMVIEWLEPQVNSVENTQMMISDSETKFYSQANHLSELQSLSSSAKSEKRRLVSDYILAHNDYLGT